MRIYLVIRELSDDNLGRQTKVLAAYRNISKANDFKQKWISYFNESDRIKALNILKTTVRIYVEGIDLDEDIEMLRIMCTNDAIKGL